MKLTFTKLILLLSGLYFSASSTLYAQSSGTTDAILQGFYWNTNPGDFASDEGVWWDTIAHVAPDLANGGIVTLWAPPANKGFAGTFDMGYGVYDYYDFGSFFQKGTLRTRHGNATQFFNTIDVLHQNGLKVMGDVVLNHRAGAEATQPEECDYQNDGVLEDRFTRFRPASGRAPMNAEDFHPTDTHCDLFGPYHDRVFFEDLCYFEDIDQTLDPSAPNNGWYHGPHNLGRAGDSLVAWGRYLIDEVGFDELRLDAVKHIEPGFMAPFLVELAEGDQPFAVGELFDGNIGTLKGYRDEVEGFVSNFGTGTKDANLAIFDFNLRFAIRDFCNNTAGGYDMSNLNNAGLLFNGMPGEDIVTFVENHDFDRIGFSPVDCSDPDVVLQEGSTCLEYTTASGHDPVVFDKHIGYAYITAAEGRPSIFWKDWFWFGLKDEIKWQLAMRSEMASGSTTPIEFLSPFFNQGNGGDMFVMNRNGNSGQGGMVLTLNDSPNTEAIAFVNTPFSNMELKDYSDAYLFTQTAAFNDSRAQVKALPRNYAWYAPTGRYPTPPDAEPTAFTLGNHEGAKLHFLALRASDAANLLVNGAPIEPGDQIAVQPVGGGDAVGLGRIGQSFEWDGVHDMVIEVLGGGNASEAKGGLLNGDGFELVIFDKSTGTTEVAATLDFAANSTGFNFNPRRPASKGGAFSLSTTHSSATYQVGAISLITGFDTRPVSCGASDAAASAYDDGWQSGDNDGSGFSAWTLSATSGNAGHFTASSTGNGDGDNNGDSDIDTGGRAWGLFANSGSTSEAIRDFAQPLVVDETFSIQMDNGFVNGTVGLALQNSDGQNLLEFLFISGSANYTLIDDSGSVDSGVGYTDEGLDISLTLTGPATYELTVTRLINGASVTLSGALINPATGSQDISRLRLFNADAGFNAPANLYFNRLEICGEPACPIASVSASTQTACNPADNTYDQEVTVNFNSTPADGQLSVNGTTVPLDIVGGAQTINLTDLVSDGQGVDATFVLTGSEACTVTETALFIAPTDCQAPTISCPADVTVDADPGACSAQVVYNTPTGADNLPGANTMLTNGEGSGADFPVGITTETYTVTDAAGNSESCSFVVTVNDAEAPQANCPTLAPVDNDAGQCGAVVNFTLPSLTDNCLGGSQSADYNSGDFFPVGTTTVTVTATDAAGNQDQCTFDVVVDDTEAPSMSCNNVTLVLDGSSGSITPAQVDGGSTDNCGVNSLSLDNGVFDCSTLGAQSVTLTAEDEAGNSNTCVATVTVEDNTAPTAACLSTTVEIQPDGTFTLQESDVYDSTNSTDNCGIDGVSFPAATYGCDDAGMSFSVGVTVTDASGNTGNCTANVSVTIGDDLPSGWASNDIGQVTVGNAYAYDPCTPTNGEFTITGSGNNAVSTTTDNVAFASQQLCGNGMITAKVESVTPNGYGGLMMRESSAAGSKQVAIFSNLTNVLRHERRTATNGPKTVQAFYRPFPIWLRLQRQGVWVFAYYSTTGSNFQYVHAVYAPMENCVEIGLASFTYLPNAQTETVFSNVSVEGSAALAGSGVPDFAQKETKQAGLQAELFPNPTSNAFILAFPEALTGEATAILRNQIGQVVAQRQLKPGDVTTEWDVRELPSGLYLLEVQWSNGFQTSFKVIRQ